MASIPPPSSGPPSSIPSSSGGAPALRARHPQTLLRRTRAMMPADWANIVAALGQETYATIDTAIPMAWLPIELDVAVIEVVARRLGPTATASVVEARQREEMGSALFEGLVKMALRVFGADPQVVVKRLPTGWSQLFRNCGTLEVVESTRKHGEVRVRGLPPVAIGSGPWMAMLPVGLAVLYELVQAQGTVTCRVEDLAKGTALLTFQWT